MTAPLTHAECLARLAACPALPRGERPYVLGVGDYVWGDQWFGRRFDTTGRGIADMAWELPDHSDDDHWRRKTAPLRRAREERRNWRVKFEDARARLVVGDAAKEHDIAEASYARGVVDGTWDAHMFHNVGAALLGFFTDLAILVRKTPAPCPFCAQEAAADSTSVTCVMCGAYGPEGTFDDVQMWNRVAIPAAFARLKDGE